MTSNTVLMLKAMRLNPCFIAWSCKTEPLASKSSSSRLSSRSSITWFNWQKHNMSIVHGNQPSEPGGVPRERLEPSWLLITFLNGKIIKANLHLHSFQISLCTFWFLGGALKNSSCTKVSTGQVVGTKDGPAGGSRLGAGVAVEGRKEGGDGLWKAFCFFLLLRKSSSSEEDEECLFLENCLSHLFECNKVWPKNWIRLPQVSWWTWKRWKWGGFWWYRMPYQRWNRHGLPRQCCQRLGFWWHL